MPQIIPAIATFLMNTGLIASGAAWTTALAVATSIVSAVAAAALGAAVTVVGKLIGGKSDASSMGSRIQLSRGSAEPRRKVYGTIRTGGVMVMGDSKGTDNVEFWVMAAYCQGPIHSFTATYFDETQVSFDGSGACTTSPYSSGPRAFAYGQLGTETQAAIPEVVAAWPSYWTSASQNKGLACRAFRLLYNRDVFPQGLPRISSVVKGALVYDPRLDSTVSGGSGSHRVNDKTTWAYSENVALCMYDYLRDDVVGPGIPNSEFNVASIIAAANVCDESVSVKAGGTVSRYTMAAEIYSTEDPAGVIERFESAMAGKLCYSAGEFHMFAGEYDTPTVSYDDSNILSVDFTTGATSDAAFNAVQGLYLSTAEDYQMADYPKITNSSYVTDDGGVEVVFPHDLPYTNHPSTAQRIAKIMLERGRQDGRLVLRTNLSGLRTKVWDTIKVTNAHFGWTNKIFRVHMWRLITPEPVMPGDGGGKNPTIAIEMVCMEEASSVYTWTAASDETTVVGGTSPFGFFPYGQSISTPFGMVVIPATVYGDLGGSIPGLEVSFGSVSDLIAYTEIQYKAAADSTWLPLQNVPAGQDTISVPIPAGTWDVRVRNVSVFGSASDWTYTYSTAITDKLIGDDVATVNGVAAQTVAAGSRVAYRETWDQFSTVAEVSATHTTNGTGELSLTASGAVTADKVIEVGNNSGGDALLIYPNSGIPFDPEKLYRVTFRVKRTAGSDNISLGLIGFNGNNSSIVDTSGGTVATNVHWLAAFGVTPTLNVWTTYTGYVKGTASTGSTTAHSDPQSPGKMQTNVRNIRWAARPNGNNNAGTYLIDEVKIEEVQGALANYDTADTPQIEPNAITDNNQNSFSTATLTVGAGSVTSVGTLNVTCPVGYDVFVLFFGKFYGTGFGDKTWLNAKVTRTGDSTEVYQNTGMPTLWNRTSGMMFMVGFLDTAIASANPSYRLDIQTQEASWSGNVQNLEALVMVVKR